MLRRILWVVLAAGVVASFQQSTFASFTASTTNGSNQFATGSLVLSNKVSSGTACFSTGTSVDVNVNAGCDSLFPVGLGYPGVAFPVTLTLRNEGSIDASDLQLGWEGAPCDDVPDPGQAYHGTGELCSQVQIKVQETQSNFSTPVACRYPTGATTCATGPSLTTFSSAGVVSLGATPAQKARYLVLWFTLPASAGNAVQGRKVSFALTARLLQ